MHCFFIPVFFVFLDVDECSSSDNNRCSQSCKNTVGSYECSCVAGFKLDSDGYACNDNSYSLLINYRSRTIRLTNFGYNDLFKKEAHLYLVFEIFRLVE